MINQGPPFITPDRKWVDRMRSAGTSVRLAAVVLLASGVAACSSSEKDGGGPDEGKTGAAAAGRTGSTTGCPDGKLLEPVLGTPRFSLAGHDGWNDGGWHCKYEPAGNNPFGYRLDVYTEREGYQAGSPRAAAGGYGAFPEFGPQASFGTECPGDPGTGRYSVHYARKGQQANTQELVFMGGAALVRDCAKQLQVMRALTKVFYENPLTRPAAG
jgi:hypothetical protein